MTHFTVGLIVPTDKLPHLDTFIHDQMTPFDEGIEVDPYVSYSLEKAVVELHRDIERLEHILERRDSLYNLDKCQDLLVELKHTTPMDRYREYARFHSHFNAQGEPLSTYNPDSKWDWYVIGGRWDGWIQEKDANGESVADNMAPIEVALARGIIPHAIITPDGQWHERGQMGWWAILITENDGWDAHARELLAAYPGHQFLILDAHI